MKRNFTHVLFSCIAVFTNVGTVDAQTTLSAGDIAFTGYNADDNTVNGSPANDDFAFVLLRSITSGTVIYFTDFGWRSDINGFQSANSCGASTGALSDGVVKWTATSNMNYGTQVYIRCKVSPSANVGSATGFQASYNVPTDYMSLATGGDNVFAFQGTLASPTLIAGIGMNGPWDATVTSCTFSSTSTTLPPALSTNNYAFYINPEVDNARLKTAVTLTGIAATDRALIHNSANWDVDDANAFALPAAITTLPVKFILFNGQIINQAAKLSWEVAEEHEVEGYKVERSNNGGDWHQMTLVPATGSKTYSWSDNEVLAGKRFYRIVSIDNDGRTKYSQVVALDPWNLSLQAKVSPNPVTDVADVTINAPNPVQLNMQLINMDGKIIWQKRSAFTAGSHVIRLYEMEKLPAGLYFFQVQSLETNFRQHISIVKQ